MHAFAKIMEYFMQKLSTLHLYLRTLFCSSFEYVYSISLNNPSQLTVLKIF